MVRTDDVFIRMGPRTGWFEPDLGETFGREKGRFMQNIELDTLVYAKATRHEANPFIQKAISDIGLLIGARIAPTWVVDDGSGRHTEVASLVLSAGAIPLEEMRRIEPDIDAQANAVIGDANLALVGLCGLGDCARGKHIMASYVGDPYQIDFGMQGKGKPDYHGLRPDLSEGEAHARAAAHLTQFDPASIMACIARLVDIPKDPAQQQELADFSARVQAGWNALCPPAAGVSIGVGQRQTGGHQAHAQPLFT